MQAIWEVNHRIIKMSPVPDSQSTVTLYPAGPGKVDFYLCQRELTVACRARWLKGRRLLATSLQFKIRKILTAQRAYCYYSSDFLSF